MSTIIFAVIVYIFRAEGLDIRSEVNWEEIERVLKLSDIRVLTLPDIEYNSETVHHIKELSQLVSEYVLLFKLTLSDRGYCDCYYVNFSSDKIDMAGVFLYPGDVTRLQQFLSNSQYQSWSVEYLYLTHLESESDWEGVAELLQSLHSVEGVYISSNCQLSTNTLRQLWDKTSGGWKVNGEWYVKNYVSNFDIFVNKHFK